MSNFATKGKGMQLNDPHLLQLFWGLRQTAGLDLRLDDYKLLVDAWETGFQPADYSELQSLCRRLWVRRLDDRERFDQYFALYFSQYIDHQYVDHQYVDHQYTDLDRAESKIKPSDAPEQASDNAEERSLQSPHASSPSSDEPSPVATSPVTLTPDTVQSIPTNALTQDSQTQLSPSQTIESDRVEVGPFTLNDEYFRPLTRRQLQQGWRGLRCLVKQGNSDQLDIPATVHQISQQGMLLEPCYLPQHVNCTELLLLVDRSNSMAPFDLLSERLIATAYQALAHQGFQAFHHYSFRNYPVDVLFSDAHLRHPVSLISVFNQLNPLYTTVLILSDAGAARGGFNPERWEQTQQFIDRVRDRVRQLAWLNPVPRQYWQFGTAKLIAQDVPMVELDLTGWRSLLKDIRGQHQSIGLVQKVDTAISPTPPTERLNDLEQRLSDLVWASPEPRWYEQAKVQILGFVRQFPDALPLICHAAFPLTLTPDLGYYLRENFLKEMPWQMIPELLLSNLCRPAGYHLYEIDRAVRHLLLKLLVNNPKLGRQRLYDLSDSLSFYVQHRLDDQLHRADDFGEKPEWIALAYAAPQALAHQLAQSLEQAYAEDEASRIQLASTVTALTEPLKEANLQPLLTLVRGVGRLARGDNHGAEAMFNQISTDWVDIGGNIRLSIPGRSRLFGIELEPIFCVTPWVVVQDDIGLPTIVKTLNVVELSLQPPNPSDVSDVSDVSGFPEPFALPKLSIRETSFSFRVVELENTTIDQETRELEQDAGDWRVYSHWRENDGYIEWLGEGAILELAKIPGGSFMMGSPPDEPERFDHEGPQHQVMIPEGFWMGRYPVTQAQWQVVARLPSVNRRLHSAPSNFKGPHQPVERVSWYEAVEFCDRLSKHTGRNYRLPTEAEWEYACRAGTKTPFHFGDTIMTDVANYDGNYAYGNGPKGTRRCETTSVTEFQLANQFGLSNMHGNVWEWCLDHWHDNYKGAPIDGSAWVDQGGKRHVVRGGSWNDNPRLCRSAYRDFDPPTLHNFSLGFRVVLGPSLT